MAKHYYNIEVVAAGFLDEEDIDDLETTIKQTVAGLTGAYPKITTEYVDSEG